jgi:excisionase family DNA binding protein
MSKACLIRAHERYGLCREEAAQYVGLGVTLFDEMVKDGRMPTSRWANGRRIWLRRELEEHVEGLPTSSTAIQDKATTDEFLIE